MEISVNKVDCKMADGRMRVSCSHVNATDNSRNIYENKREGERKD